MKASMSGHNEEQPIVPQPQCGRCHRAGTGQTTLEVIGGKWSYALNCASRTMNGDDDDDDDDDDDVAHQLSNKPTSVTMWLCLLNFCK